MTTSEEDRRIVDEVESRATDIHITKWRYSAYARTNLYEELEQRNKDELVVCGVYTHVGILATAIDSLANDIRCFVVADATADFSRQRHLSALTYVAERCGQVLFMEDLS